MKRCGGLAEEPHGAGGGPGEPEGEPDERGLPAAVRSRDGDELSLLDGEVHVGEHRLAGAVREADVLELDG